MTHDDTTLDDIQADNTAPPLFDELAAQYLEAMADSVPADALTLQVITQHFRSTASRVLRERGIALGAIGDMRRREWTISAEFWKSSGGGLVDTKVMEGTTTGQGFQALAVWIVQGARQILPPGPLPRELGAAVLRGKLENLRSTISRTGGFANMRFGFRDSTGLPWQLHATVSRVGGPASNGTARAFKPVPPSAGTRHGLTSRTPEEQEAYLLERQRQLEETRANLAAFKAEQPGMQPLQPPPAQVLPAGPFFRAAAGMAGNRPIHAPDEPPDPGDDTNPLAGLAPSGPGGMPAASTRLHPCAPDLSELMPDEDNSPAPDSALDTTK